MVRIITGIVLFTMLAHAAYANDTIVPLTLNKVTFVVEAGRN